MTYQDLLDKLKTFDEDQLDQDVEIIGECITEHYYEIDLRIDEDDGGVLQLVLT